MGGTPNRGYGNPACSCTWARIVRAHSSLDRHTWKEHSMTEARKVDLTAALATFAEPWSPHIVARYNNNKVFLAKAKGEFVWHAHPDTDDLFLVLDGRLTIELRDGEVELGPGELFVVPRGVEHRPRSTGGASILLIEPEGTPNTGDPSTAAAEVEL
jgi:mannose-6-phosphate isomerase-like protein (cupin superfamily)